MADPRARPRRDADTIGPPAPSGEEAGSEPTAGATPSLKRTKRAEVTSTGGVRREHETIRRFRVQIVEGPGAPSVVASTGDRCAIGSHELNDVVIDDPTVSRFHCEIRLVEEGAVVSDLKSRNGTFVDGVQVREAFLRGGSLLRLGRAVARFEYGAQRNPVLASENDRFGTLVGGSLAMRATFALLERAAASEATVLIEGETGTGKGKAAEAIHQASARAGRAFVIVDCSALHGNLLDSELFGHERGAFTGADARRIGAFEEASGGTVFLDEIGELPPDLQPKLLRVLENREVRRLGANKQVPVDVRVIAATNRDLRAEVNAGRFRSDLYFRLAVVKVPIPPLRTHPEDIPAMADQMLRQLGATAEDRERLLAPAFIADLQRASWPGNARELRNHFERCLVIRDAARPTDADASVPHDRVLPFAEAKRLAQTEFERRYLEVLLRQYQGRVARAAEAAGVDRVYLYRLLRRHGMKPSD